MTRPATVPDPEAPETFLLPLYPHSQRESRPLPPRTADQKQQRQLYGKGHSRAPSPVINSHHPQGRSRSITSAPARAQGFPTSGNTPLQARGRTPAPAPFLHRQQHQFRVPEQPPNQQQPPARAPPQPPQTPRIRAQSVHQTPIANYDTDNADLAAASRVRAKTPSRGNARPEAVDQAPSGAQEEHLPTSSSSPPHTPANNSIPVLPVYYTNPPNNRRELSPSPPSTDAILPLPKPDFEKAHRQASRPPSRAAPRDVADDLPTRPSTAMRRASTSFSFAPEYHFVPEPPAPAAKSLAQQLADLEADKIKAEYEVAKSREVISELQRRVESAESHSAETGGVIDMLKNDLAETQHRAEVLRESKEKSLGLARQALSNMQAQVPHATANYEVMQELVRARDGLLAEVKRLRSEMAAIVKPTFGSESEGDENQENGGIIPYRTLLDQSTEATRRARGAADIAKTATAELVAVEKKAKILQDKSADLELQVQKEQAISQVATQRYRDAEQTLAETKRTWRDEEAALREKLKALLDEQYKSLPEREIAKAAQIVAEVECRAVKKELSSTNNNLDGLRADYDEVQGKLKIAIDLLTDIDVLDKEGKIDNQKVADLANMGERHAREISEIQAALGEAADEINRNQATIHQLKQQAELTTSQRLEAEAAGAQRDQEAVAALQAQVEEMQQSLEEAQTKVVEGQAAHDQEQRRLVQQLQEMQDRGNEQEKSSASHVAKLKASVDAQSSTAKKQANQIKALEEQLEIAKKEQERLRIEAAKPKATSPKASDAARAALTSEVTKLRAELDDLRKTIDAKESELAAADEGEMARKEEIEKLVKARDDLASELAGAKHYINQNIDIVSDRENANDADLQRENRQLQDDNQELRKMIKEQYGDVQERYNTDRLTAKEEKAIAIAKQGWMEERGKEIKQAEAQIKQLKMADARSKAEIKALRDDHRARKERRSSDLSSPPRSEEAGSATALNIDSVSRLSGSATKKTDSTGRATKKARFTEESIEAKANSSKNTPSTSISTIGVGYTGKPKVGNTQQTSPLSPDPIQQFSSQFEEEEAAPVAGTSSLKSKGQKRRNEDEDDYGKASTSKPAKSTTTKPARKSTKSKSAKSTPSLAPPSTQRQTRASSRQPSDSSVITSTPMPILTQNPDKLGRVRGYKKPTVEEVDELDEE